VQLEEGLVRTIESFRTSRGWGCGSPSGLGAG
jgi:hypothetical protein